MDPTNAELNTDTTPTIDEILSWNAEEKGELPENLRTLSVDDVRATVEARAAAAAAEREQQIMARVTAEQERARLDSTRTAQDQLDSDYYTDLRNRLASSDAAVADGARQELLTNEGRYQRGAAALSRTSTENQQREVLRSFFDAMSQELTRAGFEGVIPPVGSAEWLQIQSKLAEYDGKGGFAAYLIEHGRGLAKAEYEVQLERDRRINVNSNGAPNLGGGGVVKPGDYTDPEWVKSERAKDPEWPFKLSPDGKLTNNQRVRSSTVPVLRGAR